MYLTIGLFAGVAALGAASLSGERMSVMAQRALEQSLSVFICVCLRSSVVRSISGTGVDGLLCGVRLWARK
jgi:hypothetical protein